MTPRLLATSLVTAVLLAWLPARGDWRSDEAYQRRLQKRVDELRQAVALFEQHRRALDLVEAEIASVQLGLADPKARPDRLVQRLLKQSYPSVRISMTARRTRAPQGIGVWSWRCRLQGPVGELRWAAQLLRQKGLFIRPSPSEAVQLRLAPEPPHSGTLEFIGYHVRLKDYRPKSLPPEEKGSDSFANRSDPLAVRIRQLRAEVDRLRSKVADIQGFEARINAIKQYVSTLTRLTRQSVDPFQAITPLLDLELIRFDTIKHLGARVVVVGRSISPSALSAAQRWINTEEQRSGNHYQLEVAGLYARPPVGELSVPDSSGLGGPFCSLRAANARAVDVAVATARRGAAVVLHRVGDRDSTISGRISNVPCRRALWAAVRGLRMRQTLLGHNVLLAPTKRPTAALVAPRHPGTPLTLRVIGMPLSRCLSLLRGKLAGSALEAPRAALKATTPVSLLGHGPISVWLGLLAAAAGLEPVQQPRTVRLVPRGNPGQQTLPVPDPPRSDKREPASTLTRQPLSRIRVRLLVLSRAPARSYAVVSDGDGEALVVRRGDMLGRNRSQVVRIDRQGLTLLWSGGKITARVALPLGEIAP